MVAVALLNTMEIWVVHRAGNSTIAMSANAEGENMSQHKRRYFARQPMTAFDVLAQQQLDESTAKSASRLFADGDLDDIPVANILRSMGLEE